MKIALFGATGRTGQHFLQLVQDDHHEVTLLSRHPLSSTANVVLGDATDRQAVAEVIAGADVIVSALGTDNAQVLQQFTKKLLALSPKVPIITVGTAAILQSRIDSTKLRYEAGDTKRRSTTAAEDHHTMYKLLKESSLEWTIVCPTYLPEGPVSANYRVLKDYLPHNAVQVTTGEVAHCLYEIVKHGGYNQQRIGIAQ